MKRDAFLEELAPAKRLRAAGGFEALPDGVLGTVVDFLVPVAERDDQFCQRRRMAERMFEALAYNHEFMPLARDALALLGSCRLLRYGPLFARTVVFHHMLHQNFLELCFEKLAEGCRLPQHELRALQITVERMSPAQARRHALEQALLRLAVRCTTARYRCNRHLARGAGLDRLTGRPLPSKLEDVEDEGKGGVRARTNAQGSQRLPLANNRLREVLLSRPNGELTRAGQFYYGLVGGRPPSRQFDEEQPLIREGPTDYILLRSGVKKAVRSLQPDGSYHLTKLGKSFFREKYTDWLAHVPVRITGTRQRGRNAHARVKEAALRQLDSPNDGDPIMELSQEVYRYDVQVALRQPMGALREISYQLYNGSEILPSAFEARNDKLCVARQLAELLQLPLPEVLSDFDAICDKGWEERGITALEIREFCAWRGAPMFFVSCRGELLDAYQPPVKENRAVAFTCYQAHAYFYRSARAVSHCDDTPRNEGLYRGDRKETTVPPFSEWRPWAGRVESGHFWAEDLRSVRAALLAQGHQPKVTMRSLCDWRALRLRVRDEQNYQCKLCSAPIELGCCEFDHVVPVHQALEGQPQVLQALCLECHRTKTLLESSRAACLESRVCRSVHEAYVQSPRPPALVCKLAKCDPDRICHGVDV
ncbi:pfh1, partial [Symbiodinium sp. KB8]